MNRDNPQCIQIVNIWLKDGKKQAKLSFVNDSYLTDCEEIAHLYLNSFACRKVSKLLLQAADKLDEHEKLLREQERDKKIWEDAFRQRQENEPTIRARRNRGDYDI